MIGLEPISRTRVAHATLDMYVMELQLSLGVVPVVSCCRRGDTLLKRPTPAPALRLVWSVGNAYVRQD